jgi:hypothetical protein
LNTFNKGEGKMKNELVDLAKKKIQRKRLEWEHENKEEILQTVLYVLDPDLVYEAAGECSDVTLMKVKRLAMEKNYAALGLILGPTIESYLWQQGADEWERIKDESEHITLRDSGEYDKETEHESLTTAQRNPDLCS